MCSFRVGLAYVHILLVCIGLKVVSTENFKLAIIHTNDVHARFEQTNKYGSECSESDTISGKCFDGVARRATKIKELRNNMTNTILLDAGDQFQGTVWYSHYSGFATAFFMNKLQYDAMALGNHEFDAGVDGLLSFAENLTFPLLSSNLDVSKESRLQGKVFKSTVLEVSNQKVGVIGYTTEKTREISKPGNTVSFEGEIAAVRKEAETLTKAGVNKIIALGHAGYPLDLQLAKEVSNIDVVVGGHSHTFLYTGTKPPDTAMGPYPTIVKNTDGNNVPVVTAYRFGKYLGYIVLEFDDSGNVVSWQGSPILLDNSTAQDKEVLGDIQRFIGPVNEYKKLVVGSSLVYLEGDTNLCRKAECNMGNLYADALIWYYQPKTPSNNGWTDAAIAFVNSGGIREPIHKGPINMADLSVTFPYGNTVDIISIKGEHLLKVLEYGASRYSFQLPRYGGFLQMSGARVVYDMNKPIGSRVVSVMLLCARCDMPVYSPLNKTEVYRVITVNFIINGGDGYTSLRDTFISKDGRDDLDITVMKDYIARFSPIVTAIDGRIEFIDEKSECDTSSADRPVNFTYCVTIMASIVMILFPYLL